MNTRTDNLKKITFVVMAILFFVNLSLMEKAHWVQRSDLDYRKSSIDLEWQAGTRFVSKADEIKFLRMTATKLQATQHDLLQEIDRLESRIRVFESQAVPSLSDQIVEHADPGSERQ